jgi:U3 small nucleolar RNA-associated protein 14
MSCCEKKLHTLLSSAEKAIEDKEIKLLLDEAARLENYMRDLSKSDQKIAKITLEAARKRTDELVLKVESLFELEVKASNIRMLARKLYASKDLIS